MKRSVIIRAGAVVATLLVLVLVLVFIVTQVRPSGDGDGAPVSGGSDSIRAGAQLFEANCARCHGADARGGGPDAGTTPARPPSLVTGHIADHSDEEIFTIISEGLPGGMPAWQETLSVTERWHLVNYLRSLQES